jgi:hypothetical protein
MSYPKREEVFRKWYLRRRDSILNTDRAICELDHLTYPNHTTAYLTLSNAPDPDVVVIYTYGGLTAHHFYKKDDGTIADNTETYHQFTYEWVEKWLANDVAFVVFDAPDYFVANGHPFISSFYRRSPDRVRESKQLIDVLSAKFPNSKIVWAGLSYGAQEAAAISLEDTQLHKVANLSATWHVLADTDEFHQGARLDWYNVTDSKIPVLVVMHEKEVWDKAREQMQLTDSILVTNDVSADDGHFFRERQAEVIKAICDWFRDKPVPKIIP